MSKLQSRPSQRSLLFVALKFISTTTSGCDIDEWGTLKLVRFGISFETAAPVFDDPYHISNEDREVEGELRWQTIGVVNGPQVLRSCSACDYNVITGKRHENGTDSDR
jgi:hypothetical protein